jgi:hypothetical protein
LQTEGDNILYIYGEYDPTTACGINPTGQVSALKIVLPGESHMAGMSGFGSFTSEVYDSLESWLGIEIDVSQNPIPRYQPETTCASHRHSVPSY